MVKRSTVQFALQSTTRIGSIELGGTGVYSAVGLAAELERLIVSGAIEDGVRLPTERELAEGLEISRASVREAMYELSLKGLVDRRRSRGSVVVFRHSESNRLLQSSMPHEHREFWEVIEFRAEIEPVIAQRAATTATPSELLALREILRSQENASDKTSAIRDDRAFHIQIAALTHNQLFVRLAEVSADWLSSTRERSQATAKGRRQSVVEHRAILEAISDNDPERAGEAMREHIRSVAELARPAQEKPRRDPKQALQGNHGPPKKGDRK